MTETLYSLVVMRPLVGQDLSEVRVTSFGKTLPLFFARQRLANLEQPPWNVWFVPVYGTGEIGFIRDIQDSPVARWEGWQGLLRPDDLQH